MKKCILVLGGARSGKSRFAQEIACQLGDKVLFVATAEALDEEMRSRIEDHKRERPLNWRTIEVSVGVGKRIQKELGNAQVIIIDCITLLVSNVISQCGSNSDEIDSHLVEQRVALEVDSLVQCINSADAVFIIVSNEVGMGLVPDNRLGRFYRDLLGRANQEIARCADEVLLLIAGISMKIKGKGSI